MIDSVDPRTPVLVGIGPIEQRQDDPSMASDALALMVQAVRAAGQDSGRPELLQRVNVIAVPKGRWRYEDPGRHIATSLGSHNCESILALVGILQQSLIGECCQRIADGAAD